MTFIYSSSLISQAKYQEFCQYFSDLAHEAATEPSTDKTRELQSMSVELINYLREQYQNACVLEVKNLIEKLKKESVSLSADEQEILLNFTVGDTRSYLAQETNHQSCLADLQMLAEQLAGHIPSESDSKALLEELGKAMVLRRITQDLSFYDEERHRIGLTKKALADGISRVEAAFFADILKHKLTSSKV
ncbi:MAG: hypothetical protein SFT81_00325 [Candidatus Caenarcaniphilales bacterium]|nr:hypothetical protein [Candidatus Caenarcaniphilales bacterium]